MVWFQTVISSFYFKLLSFSIKFDKNLLMESRYMIGRNINCSSVFKEGKGKVVSVLN
jgi:hypothetical protein